MHSGFPPSNPQDSHPSRKHSRRFITRNEIHIVVLARGNFLRAPTEVTVEILESLNQDCRLDDHVDKSRNMGAIRHLKSL